LNQVVKYISIICSVNDAGIWSNTAMCQAFENNTISIPQPRPLPNTDIVVPFSIVGDEGFPLKSYLMRPYARRNLQGNEQRIFNYRLSRARRIVENAFGILAARWKILKKPISVKLQTTETILQAITCLHNYIITTGFNDNCYLHEGITDRESPNGELIEENWRNVRGNGLIEWDELANELVQLLP